jgi:hypothetical protein
LSTTPIVAVHASGKEAGVAGLAAVLPGRLALVADHLVLALRSGATQERPSFVLSWYGVEYAAAAPAGNLAFVRAPGIDGGERILTDSAGLDRALRGRLQPRSWPFAHHPGPAEAATFSRSGVRDGTVEARIEAPGLKVEVSWRELGEPIVATGRVGADPPWDSSTVLIEAAAWAASVNGQAMAGEPFANEVWIGWFGRPLSSALVAFAEVFREAPV